MQLIPMAESNMVAKEEVAEKGVISASYSNGYSQYLLSSPDNELGICALYNGKNSFYEVVVSKTRGIRYWVVIYNSARGTFDTSSFHEVNMDGERNELYAGSSVYENFQIRTRYNSPWTTGLSLYQNSDDILLDYSIVISAYPITYSSFNVTLSGPATAAVGATVNVDCTFPAGYGVKTTDTISVTCNRTPVSFLWDSENQRITFTMPDPS